MSQEELVLVVIDVVQATLNDSAVQVQATTALQDLSAFDSLVVVGVLERLEQQLNIEMEPGLILPETFATPRSIAAALMQSTRAAHS